MPDYGYGEAKYGTFLYGGYAAPAVGQQGYIPGAKPDTVFLSKSLDGTIADICDDLSQIDTNLTNQTTYGDESASSRTAITYPRCLEAVVVMDTTGSPDGGVLIDHSGASGGQQSYNLAITNIGAPTLNISQNDGSITTLAVPTNGTTDKVTIVWSTEANPLTTGAGDACRSEIWIYNHHGNEYAHTTKTHAVPTTNTSWDLTVGADRGGSSVFSGEMHSIRISEAFHSSTEWYEDWIGSTTTPTLTAETRLEGLIPSKASGFGDDGQFVHQFAPAAAAVRKMDLRLTSPLVNEVYLSPEEWDQSFSPSAWVHSPPGVTLVGTRTTPLSHILLLPYCRWVPVADSHNKIYVRVQVQNYTDGGTARELEVRCYTMSRRPIIGGLINPGNPPDQLDYAYCESQTTTDHTSTGTGEWLALGLSRIARDEANGGTWLCLSTQIHNAVVDNNARYKIKGWTVDSCRVDGGNDMPDAFKIGDP